MKIHYELGYSNKNENLKIRMLRIILKTLRYYLFKEIMESYNIVRKTQRRMSRLSFYY